MTRTLRCLIALSSLALLAGREIPLDLICHGGQVWKECGSACTKTCLDLNPLCIEQCVAKCECPPEKPVWENGACIAVETCPSQSRCSGGQVWNECGSACIKTCDDLHPLCTKQCVAKCECPPEKPLWENGACIAVATCPSQPRCSGGQVWNECGSACTKTCDDLHPLCTKQCVAKCECPPEKPVWENGACIAVKTCPSQPRCSGDQVWKECGSACTKTCADLHPLCTEQCVAKCECPPEKPVWENGACIAVETCPSQPRCSGGQVWNECGSACTKTCDDLHPLCTKQCVAKCECPPEKPLWENGACIAVERCPSQSRCSGGQVWNECGSACTKTCADLHPLCTEQCVATCECPPEKPVWEKGECVSECLES